MHTRTMGQGKSIMPPLQAMLCIVWGYKIVHFLNILNLTSLALILFCDKH